MFKWIHDYQLFLFDFDGLLVNTEELHYNAYQMMCARRGFTLFWDFHFFCQIAHYSSEGLKEQMYKDVPGLYHQEPQWEVLYKEKTQAYLELIENGSVALMAGVVDLLETLQKSNIKRAVVTNSSRVFVETIKNQHPILQTIPNWVTREDYLTPKPSSDCYNIAIKKYAENDDRIIGFEDTPRGIKALLGTSAKPILISELNYPEIPHFLSKGVFHYKTLQHCSLRL